MKDIVITAPVKKPEDIELFSKATSCRDYYVYYKKFLDNNFDYVKEFVDVAKRCKCNILSILNMILRKKICLKLKRC